MDEDGYAEGTAGGNALWAIFAGLYRSLSHRRRRQLLLLLAVMLLGALAELMTIGAVLPFLALVSDPAGAAGLPGFSVFLAVAGGGPGDNLVLRATILLIAATISAAIVRLLILSVTQRFALSLGHEIGAAVFSRMLHQPYSLYVTRNSSELLASVEKVQILVFAVLLPAMQGVIASVIATCIILLLIAIEPWMAAVAGGSVTFVYFAVSLATGRRLRANSRILGQMANARIKALQEGLGGIRDILLDRSQPIFEENFRRIDRRFRKAQAANLFIGAAPRHVVEAAGIILIGLLALHMSFRSGGIVAAIPALGALALGAQRLLPLLQLSWFGWSQLAGNVQILRDVLTLMHAPAVVGPPRDPDRPVVAFASEIVFDRVSFQYPSREYAVRDVSLRIGKGARVGLIGTTGSGKSSFLDLMMALLDPTSGEIRVDGRPLDDDSRADWQAQIAHVPQSVYLSDSSIAANIAFGMADAEIAMDRVREAARRAQIDGFVAALPEGYETLVGERGVRLSGGQRQRIAIARALYKRANVLIFDEATGALDHETEKAVMDSLAGTGAAITILIVAHRLSALAGCDLILRFEAGRVVETASHAELTARGGR